MKQHSSRLSMVALTLALQACNGLIGTAPAPYTRRDTGTPIPVPNSTLTVRRLTNLEYDETVKDLLGVTSVPSQDFPADPRAFGFDNDATSLTISPLHAERYRGAAESLASTVVHNTTLRTQLLGCDVTSSARMACLEQFVRSFARRAYRRPVTEAEVSSLMALATVANNDPDPMMSPALVVEAVLQSPSFLFRTEKGEVDSARPGLRKLDGYEIATRLSYALWGTTPDETLLTQAKNGDLDTADGVENAAQRLLADPRAHKAISKFLRQWLRLESLSVVHRDTSVYPEWSDDLRDAMAEETARDMEELVWGDNKDFLDILSSKSTYVNASLASLYGLQVTIPPNTWTKVDLTGNAVRGGLFTHASYLTLTAHSESSMIIHRGKYVRDVLLCQPLPPPPLNAPVIPAPIPGETDIQRLERHRSDPACRGCHTMMDPIGTGLRRYNMIGAYRPLDMMGQPIAQTGSIEGLSNSAFDGPIELGEKLKSSPDVSVCVVRQTYRYVFGRLESMTEENDLPYIRELAAGFQTSNHNFRALLLAVVRSDAFRYGRTGIVNTEVLP